MHVYQSACYAHAGLQNAGVLVEILGKDWLCNSPKNEKTDAIKGKEFVPSKCHMAANKDACWKYADKALDLLKNQSDLDKALQEVKELTISNNRRASMLDNVRAAISKEY